MISKYTVFCKAIETGSLARTEAATGISRSAVRQTIDVLEKGLGAHLVELRDDRVTLSKTGSQYYPFFQEIAAAHAALDEKEREMKGEESSLVRIGTITSFCRPVLTKLMYKYVGMEPETNFRIRQGALNELMNWLDTDGIDFAVRDCAGIRDHDVTPLYTDELKACIPADHPLAKKEEVSLEDLAKVRLILLGEGDDSRPRNMFRDHGVTPHIHYELDDDYSAVTMVGQGNGIALIYDRILHELNVPGIVVRPIEVHPFRKIGIIWRNRETMTRASRRFADFIVDEVAEYRALD